MRGRTAGGCHHRGPRDFQGEHTALPCSGPGWPRGLPGLPDVRPQPCSPTRHMGIIHSPADADTPSFMACHAICSQACFLNVL